MYLKAFKIRILKRIAIFLGDFGCKSGIFVLDVFLGASMLSLVFISLDRYFGICRRLVNADGRRITAAALTPLIWVSAALVYLPMAFTCEKSKVPGSLACDCHSRWPKQKYYAIFSFYVTFVIYVVPFASMLVCYYKICRKLWGNRNDLINSDPTGSKKKSIKMLVATTVVFFIAWTPYNCLYVLKKLEAINPKLLG